MSPPLETELRDGVARVILNRPAKRNAVDLAMFEAIREAGTVLAADPSLRAVVLHGAGGHFCAGIDVTLLTGGHIDPEWMRPRGDSAANLFQSASCAWRHLPVPVIAALEGVAFGAGLQIALGADVRIATRDTRLSIMEIEWGLVPDLGLTTTLPSLVSYDDAVDLIWTGRLVSGEEALELGLVTRLADDPVESAAALAGEIAGRSPDAIRAAKQLVRDSYAERDPALLRREADLQMRIMAAPNSREAMQARLGKRSPKFGDSSL